MFIGFDQRTGERRAMTFKDLFPRVVGEDRSGFVTCAGCGSRRREGHGIEQRFLVEPGPAGWWCETCWGRIPRFVTEINMVPTGSAGEPAEPPEPEQPEGPELRRCKWAECEMDYGYGVGLFVPTRVTKEFCCKTCRRLDRNRRERERVQRQQREYDKGRNRGPLEFPMETQSVGELAEAEMERLRVLNERLEKAREVKAQKARERTEKAQEILANQKEADNG